MAKVEQAREALAAAEANLAEIVGAKQVAPLKTRTPSSPKTKITDRVTAYQTSRIAAPAQQEIT